MLRGAKGSLVLIATCHCQLYTAIFVSGLLFLYQVSATCFWLLVATKAVITLLVISDHRLLSRENCGR